MAKKGQKFDKYSNDTKEQVVQELTNGESYRYLARKYNIPLGTVSTWQQKIRHPEIYQNQGVKRGRQKESEIDYKERYQILKKYQAFLKVQRERK